MPNSKVIPGQQLCPSFACSKNLTCIQVKLSVFRLSRECSLEDKGHQELKVYWGKFPITHLIPAGETLRDGFVKPKSHPSTWLGAAFLLCASRCRDKGRSSRTTAAGLAPADPPGRELWLCSPLALDEVQGIESKPRSGRSRQRMQMPKFSPSSHPCGMQDESCPNGAHSCYFGGLRRCVPGHHGQEKPHTATVPSSLAACAQMEKGGTGPFWLPETPCLSQRAWGCWKKEGGLPRQ